MATTFPTTIDTKTTSSSSDYLSTSPHSTLHNNLEDRTIALETKVGVDSSAVTTSHDFKLSGVTGTDKAVSKTGIETLTNKTLTSPIVSSISNTGTLTLPTSTDTLVGRATTDTLTNKTLTSPTITGAAIDTTSTLTSSTINTPTLILANSSPTADGSIGFDRTGEDLQVGDGTNSQIIHMGEWVSFTPSWTHLTPGSGTNVGYYCQIGKLVVFNIRFTMAADSSVGAAEVSLTLPVTKMSTHTSGFMGMCNYTDYNTATYAGYLFHYGTMVSFTNAAPYILYVSTTSPFTWTTNDSIFINGFYEAA